MIHITGTSAVNLPPAAAIRLTVNAALTGTYTVVDGNGNTVAVITNPPVGSSFLYEGINGAGTITASAVGDATVGILSRNTV